MNIIFVLSIILLILSILIYIDAYNEWEFYTKQSDLNAFKNEILKCKKRFAISVGLLLLDIMVLLILFNQATC